MKSKEIAKAVDNLPVCDDGKKKILELLKVLGHEVTTNIHPKPKRGQVWMTLGTPVLLVNPAGALGAFKSNFVCADLIAVSLSGGGYCPNVRLSFENETSNSWSFIAGTLEEYYKDVI